MTKIHSHYWRYAIFSIIAFALDQASKFAIVAHLQRGQRINIIPHFFDLIYVVNKGAAFSFLANAGGWQKYFFIILALAIVSVLQYMIYHNKLSVIGSWAASLICGGALGNVFDRLYYNHVIDFLLFYIGDHFYPAFNIADSFITVGVIFLFLDGYLKDKSCSHG